jgi:alpha-1,2-mannosyltransferase
MLRRLVPHLDHLSPGRVFLLVWIPLFSLFFATAQKSTVHSLDTYTNVLTAWSLASEHTIYADPTPGPANPGDYGIISWFTTTSSGRLASQYPPGAALVAAPFYLASPATRQVTLPEGATRLPGEVTVNLPSLVPAAVAASLTSSLAIALLGLLFLDFLTPAQTVAGAYIAGLGTSAWSVASDALWQHGPAMLWIALALYLISRDHRLWAGVAFGMAILTRPHLALIAASVGIAVALGKRVLRPMLEVGAGASLGLAALIAYNWGVFGSLSVSGGYGSGFTDQLLHSHLGWYLRNIFGALLDPRLGLLIWSPFLIILIFGLADAWKAAPAWVRGAAIGGMLYLLVQLKANRFSGGEGFFSYRYPLEALTAVAPLLALSWKEWVARTSPRTKLFLGTVILAVIGQGIGAIVL